MRHRLDCAFEILPLGEPEHFARINPDYNGNCPMLDTDGYCLLQKEQGEEALPLICRVYPRSVKRYGDKTEICMSNSCERTIELLIETTEPLRMQPVNIRLPFDGIKIYDANDTKDFVRKEAIRLMENRALPLCKRLENLCDFIGDPENSPVADNVHDCTGASAIHAIRAFILTIRQKSRSIGDCGGKALTLLGDCGDDEAYEKFKIAKQHLCNAFPHIEDYAEKLIVNHMIFEGFPYIADAGSPAVAFSSLLFSVALLRFICVFGMMESHSLDDLVDLMAEAYRFVEHSGFYAITANRHLPDFQRTFYELSPLLL